ncbi:DUF6452 family protein [Flavobacterium sp. RSB2_4_14]|uniref:DUF6452 family protein n=1 Tax=Flavobacterium sp. RSB2_4_14 TaxID=3447665 RepID=UPI003F37DD49
MKKIILLLFIAITLSSCEKDDICADETTPQLVMEFYDVTNPTVKKNVNNLKVTGYNSDNTLMVTPLATFNGVSVIKLPLRITEDTTSYSLILNSAITTNINEDKIQFDYTRQNVYVSRACGYKTIFTLNSPNGVTRTDSNTTDGFWMQFINIQTTNIDTENEVHIKVFF